jgi:hypothetical protein
MTDVAKDAPDHGRLYDNFSRQSTHPHGGSYFDSGFTLQAHTDAHGKLYDLFGVPKDSSAHGERFDEFGWKDMPTIHGQSFDTDFRQPTAHTSGEHGTWYDEFRGGTEVRYMLDGADYEGTVVECNTDHAVVRAHDGQTHEVGLSQFLAYRSPSLDQASPGLPDAAVDSPSAHDHTAHGNFGTTGKPAITTEPSVTEHVSEGPGNPDARSSVPGGIFDTFTSLKSLVREYEDDVAKDVDATETATQAQDLEGDKHAWCPHCKHECKRPTGEGTCPTCGTKVEVGKSAPPINSSTGALGIDVPERDHKATDHHSDRKGSRRCPHCDGILDELEEKAEQGQPTRTHKCLGSSLDVLKTLVEA